MGSLQSGAVYTGPVIIFGISFYRHPLQQKCVKTKLDVLRAFWHFKITVNQSLTVVWMQRSVMWHCVVFYCAASDWFRGLWTQALSKRKILFISKNTRGWGMECHLHGQKCILYVICRYSFMLHLQYGKMNISYAYFH